MADPQEHTIVVKGRFTEEDMRQIIDVVNMIEAARPTETFHVFIDAPDMKGEPERILGRINPLRPGYERSTTTTQIRRDQDTN
jgi:hypothetical protein